MGFFHGNCQRVKWGKKGDRDAECFSRDILSKKPGDAAGKRKDEVNVTRLRRNSSLVSRTPFLFPRRCFIALARSATRKVIMRNHFYAFATLTLMMKRLSTLWAHLLFILRLTIIINCRLYIPGTSLPAKSFTCLISLWCSLEFDDVFLSASSVRIPDEFYAVSLTSSDNTVKVKQFIYLFNY